MKKFTRDGIDAVLDKMYEQSWGKRKTIKSYKEMCYYDAISFFGKENFILRLALISLKKILIKKRIFTAKELDKIFDNFVAKSMNRDLKHLKVKLIKGRAFYSKKQILNNTDNLKGVDRYIKKLIVELNKIPGIETESSCSGHFDNDNNSFIWFKYNKNKNMKKILKFFKKMKFKIEKDESINSIGDNLKLIIDKHYSVYPNLTSTKDEHIKKFWNNITNKFIEYKNEKIN